MDDQTLTSHIPSGPAPKEASRYLATIVFHPCQSFIGATAELPQLGGSIEISRSQTTFLRAVDSQPLHLEDRYISRKPLVISHHRDGLRLSLHSGSTPVYVDGETLYSQADLNHQRLHQGVVLDFHRRVLIFIHHQPEMIEKTDDQGLVGVSEGICAVRSALAKVAELDLPVLVRGESGTGKELVAQAIHRLSRRKQQKFLAVNISAIAESLVIAELFGAKKGAYTGATADKQGLFQQADKGSLFLDEIGDARDEVQLALLRALETKEIRPVGSNDSVKVDIRFIAATDADLEEKLRDKRFRNPLLQRLSGYEIWLPALRHRRVDIGILLSRFLLETVQHLRCAEMVDPAKPDYVAFWRKLFLLSIDYDWPGNVRQLRNVVQQVVIHNRGSEQLSLPPHLVNLFEHSSRLVERPRSWGEPRRVSEQAGGVPPVRRKPSTISEDELFVAFDQNRYDMKNTAEALGISRAALYKLIEANPGVHKAGDLSVGEIEQCFRDTGGDIERMVSHLKVSKAALKRRLKEMRLL